MNSFARRKKMNDNSEDKFKYKLGKWVLLRDECVFTSLECRGKSISMRQYLLESIDNWANKKEDFPIQEFVAEMCEFIKSKNESIYFRLMEKCALKGISVGDGIFEALSMCQCEEAISNLQCGMEKDESSDL
jgi:hypothetical protein